MVRVKICGITRAEDALAAEAAGADAVGFVLVASSRRHISVAQAARVAAELGPFIARVGVFVDAPLSEVREAVAALRLDAVQLHGQESAAYAAALRPRVRVIRALSFRPDLNPAALQEFPADAWLLDGPRPGGGEAFDWSQARVLAGLPKLILAGGLTPQSVAAGVRALRPYAVDVSSGVELSPGIKDPQAIQEFVRAAKRELSTVIHRLDRTCG